MGEALKILGQSTPTATTLTDLYTVPSTYSSAISSITICNQNSSTTALFRVSVAPAGASDTQQQYLYYDLPLLANDTFIATIGISLAQTDVIRIQSSVSNVSFNLLGVEIAPGATPPPPTNAAGGDLSGFYPDPTVSAINGVAVTGVPSSGQVLTATGSAAADWQTGAPPSGAAGGDLSGTYPDPAVAQLQGSIVLSGTPSTGQVLTATSSTAADWQTPGGGGSATLPVTFQPGGTAEPNVFVTEGALNTALGSSFGPQTVYVDLNDSSGAYTTGAAVTFGSFLIGVPFYSNGGTPVLTLATATSLTGDTIEINDIRLIQESGPNFTVEPLVVRARGNALLYSNDGSTLYQVSAGTSVLEVYDGAIIGTGTNTVINVQSGATLNVYLYGAATPLYGAFYSLNAAAITVAGGGALNIHVMSSGATFDPSYATLSGATIIYHSATVLNGGTTSANITSGRSVHQSPIDNTQNGIVNLSSDTTGLTAGATNSYATISGGDQNIASGQYSTVLGGFNNTASGNYSIVGGSECETFGNGAVSLGYACVSSGQGAFSTGFGTFAGQLGATTFGIISNAYLTGMMAHSCGSNFNGGNQWENLTYFCTATGATPVVFTDNTSGEFILRNGYAMTIRARVVAARTDSAAAPSTYEHILTVHATGSAITIDKDQDNSSTNGFDNGLGWSIAFSGSGTTLHCTFTGAAAMNVNATLHYDIVDAIGTGT